MAGRFSSPLPFRLGWVALGVLQGRLRKYAVQALWLERHILNDRADGTGDAVASGSPQFPPPRLRTGGEVAEDEAIGLLRGVEFGPEGPGPVSAEAGDGRNREIEGLPLQQHLPGDHRLDEDRLPLVIPDHHGAPENVGALE